MAINGTPNSDNPLNGTNSADTINGLGGNDKIFAKDGNDTITGGAGNDDIDGGKDYDIAVYSGSFFDYQITRSGSKFTIKDNVANRDGTDTTVNVEELKFSDGTHIYLDGRNNGPIARDDAGTTNEDSAITLNVLGNDVDFDGDAMTITKINGTSISVNGSVNLAGGGKVTLKSDGKLYFSPDGDFNALNNGQTANVSFTYTVKDSKGATDTASVAVTVKGVSPVNHGPVANNDSASLNENATVTKTAANGLLSNDTDADHDTLTVTKVGSSTTPGAVSGTYGTLTWAADGSYSYIANKPAADALAQGQTAYDSFTYMISDGHGGTCTATLKFTICGINDTPVANDDVGTVNEDATLTKTAGTGVLVNDTDPDAGATKAVSKVNGSSSGVNNNVNGTYGTLKLKADGSYTYVADKAAADALGVGATAVDTFTYEMKDDKGATDTASLKITVVGVNDAPDAKDDSGNVNKSQTTNGNVLTNDTDPDVGDTLTVTQVNGNPAKVGQPVTTSYGTLTLQSNGTYSYVANGAASLALGANATAYDTFTYKISDGNGGFDTATLKIKISGTASTNHAPTAVADTNAGDPVIEQGAATAGDPSAAGNVLTNDTDTDAGDTKTVVGVDNGTLAGPLSGDVGTAVEGTYGSVTIQANGTWSYALNNADPDTNALAQGASVTDVFTYTMQDSAGAKSTTTLTINITGSNDGPTAVADTNTGDPVIEQGTATAGDASATGNVLTNDTDPDTGDTKTVVGVDNGTLAGPLSGDVGTAVEGTYGSVTILANGTWTYALNDADPDTQALADGASVADVFTYTMQDGAGVTSTTTLTINITGSNDGPTAVADTNGVDAVTESGVNPGNTAFPGDDTAAGNVLTNDTDPDTGDSKSVVGVDNGTLAGPLSGDVGTAVEGTYGSVTIGSNGAWTYTLNNADTDTQALAQGDSVTDVFSYTMKDGSGATSTTTLTITITGTNDAPVIDGTTGVSGDVNEPGDIPGIDEAGLGGGLEPFAALVTPSIQSELDAIIANPSSTAAHLANIETALGDTAQAIAVVWDFLDDNYSYYNTEVNEAFIRLGVEYVDYLQNGGAALFDVTAKYRADSNDPGSDPDRFQSLHDNLLGNMNTVGMADRFSTDPVLLAELTLLVTNAEPDLLARPYYSGEEGDPNGAAARQFDLDHEYVPHTSGTLVATDVDTGASLTWSANTTDGTYGTFALDSGTGDWTYTLDDYAAADALAEGESDTDTFTVTVTDEHGATDTQVVTITVHGTNDAPVITDSSQSAPAPGIESIAGIDEAGPGATPADPDLKLEPASGVVTQDIQDLLDQIPTNPSDLANILADVTTEVGGGAPLAIAIVWDFIDDNYSYYNNAINEAAVRLGLAYADYLRAGGDPLTGVIAKYTKDGGDAGSDPDRVQSLHDNLLGNLDVASMQDKLLGGGQGGSNPSPEPGLYDTLFGLVDDAGLASRPIYGGYEGTANNAVAFDLANGLLSYSGDLDATDVDNGAVLTWTAADTDGTSYGNFVIDPDTGEWTYTADPAATASLAAGESATDTFLATVTDENGAADTINVTITINGVNDDPTITSDPQSGSVTEFADNSAGEAANDAHTADGAVTFADLDTSDTHSASFAPQGGGYVGTFSLDAVDQSGDSVGWHFTVDDADIDGLAVDETLTQSYNVTVDDGHGGTATQTVTITINGANDVVYTVNDAVDPSATVGGAGTELFVGSGIPNNGFGLANQTDVGVELGFQIIYRQGPTVLSSDDYSDGVLHFTVNDGPQSTVNGSQMDVAGRAAWSFDYSIATGVDGETGSLADYTFHLKIDVDPTAAVSYHTLELVPGTNAQTGMVWIDTDLSAPPGPTTINGHPIVIADDEGTANVAQNSQNYAFYQSILTGGAYGPGNGFDGPATFDLVLEAYRGANLLASNHVVVDVVEVVAQPGQVLVLDQNGTLVDDFTSIQAAIDSAGTLNGYTILVGTGTYNENVTVNKELTITGSGPGTEIHGTFQSGNAMPGTVYDFLKTAPGYTAASGTGVTIAADNVTLQNLKIDSFFHGIDLADNVDHTAIENVDIESFDIGIHKGPTSNITDLTVTGGTLSDGYIGVNFEKTTTPGQAADGTADGIVFDGMDFEDLLQKGIYVEALSNAQLLNLMMLNVGQWGGVQSHGGNGNSGNGINLNLKNGVYSNIEIANFHLTDTGDSSKSGSAATSHANGGAIVVEARDDGTTYGPAPATLTNVTIHDGTIDGNTSTGIHVGEPGKANADPDVTMTNVTITGAEHSAAHGDIANESDTSLFTITGTSAGDSLIASGNSDGSFKIDGGGGADTIKGGSAGDTLIGGGDSDSIDGAGGMDTAKYNVDLSASDFSFDTVNNKWIVGAGLEGTDNLTGVERVVDSGGQVFLLVGAGGFSTIQAAIDASTGGETILIAPGTYTESGSDGIGHTVGLYINKADLTLQGFSSDDGSLITTAADAQAFGPTVISGHQTGFGANHWVDVGGDGLTIQGLHLQAGTETTNKLLEIWADDVTVQNNFIDVNEGGVNYTFAAAVYLNDNPPGDEITAYSISNNILNEGIIVSNGVGEASDPEPATNQLIEDNHFIGTFDSGTGEGRYDTVVLNGAVNGTPWLTEAVQIPTISGNTFENNTTPFILRGSDNDVSNLPTATQIQLILDTNGDNDLHYAYVVDSSDDLVTATRDDGGGEYHSFAVTNTIDTLNLALDPTPDEVFGGQRDYIHAGDTIRVQSGDTGTVNSEIMVENLSVRATEHSGDLNLTLATDFADGSAIAGGGVHNITLLDYAAGQGADVDVTGNAVSNAIVGNSGENDLRGMGSNDILLGGDGADTFTFGMPEATDGIVDFDIIGDFQDNVDLINIMAGVTHTQVDFAGGSLITLSGDGDKIYVAGVSAANLDFVV